VRTTYRHWGFLGQLLNERFFLRLRRRCHCDVAGTFGERNSPCARRRCTGRRSSHYPSWVYSPDQYKLSVMKWPGPGDHATHDESGMSLVELMVAVALFLVVITIGLVVTTALITGTSSTQQSAILTGPAQNGMQVLRDFFSGAVPANSIPTPSGTNLYTSLCVNPAAAPFPSGSFVSGSSTDVWLCSVRSGSRIAYTYEIHFASPCPTTSATCTLQVDLQRNANGSNPQTVEVINNVCAHCVGSANTSFVFSTSPNSVPMPQSVMISLTLASNLNPPKTTTLTSNVMLLNSLGGPL
jgi:hypothetical protein